MLLLGASDWAHELVHQTDCFILDAISPSRTAAKQRRVRNGKKLRLLGRADSASCGSEFPPRHSVALFTSFARASQSAKPAGPQLFSASTGALSVVFLMSETARSSPVF